jgi:hypothetical protein
MGNKYKAAQNRGKADARKGVNPMSKGRANQVTGGNASAYKKGYRNNK